MSNVMESRASALNTAQRARLAQLADALIAGGYGLPSASDAQVHEVWGDRVLELRPDLLDLVLNVASREASTDPNAELQRLRRVEPATFEGFAYFVSSAYLINPRVRKILGYPGDAPKPNPAFPDEAEFYLSDNILQPVIDRGPIYRDV